MKDYSAYSDSEIWSLLAAGEEEALAHIFHKYYPGLCRIAYRMTGDTQASEDLGQEVYVDLWKKRQRLHIQTSIQGYLRKALSNRTLNYIRDQKIRSVGDAKILAISSKEPNAQELMQSEDLQKRINEAILELPDRCRLIFILSRYQKMTYSEIAGNLDISPKTVENQVAKALRLLRNSLGPIVGCLLIILFHMIAP
ncbi:MAG: RNA polymerase sigma-70 factor [Saprospiraceae bacterium]|nr:RNA polymerase sigma-70 factor [Saprospiraceae bacterium]